MTRFILLRRIPLDYRVRNTVGGGAYTPERIERITSAMVVAAGRLGQT